MGRVMPVFTNKPKYGDEDDSFPNDLALLAYAREQKGVYWCRDCKTLWMSCLDYHPSVTFKVLEFGVKEQPTNYKHKLCPDSRIST